MEPTPQQIAEAQNRLVVQSMMVEFAPHWHAIIEGPMIEHDDGTRGRAHADIRLFAATRDEAQVEIMEGLADSCFHMDLPFDPSEWTLLDLHMHGGN